jgi:hypothetical protein
MKATAATNAAAPVALCVQCNERPWLAALDRCKECIRAGAAEDRDTRSAAEARVSQKQQLQTALEAWGDVLLQFAPTPEGQQFLQQQHAELVGPRNDPEYLNALVERDKQREIAANEIAVLHHIVKHGRSHGTVTFKNDRDLAKTRETFRILQSLLETKLYCHADPHDPLTSPVTSQKRPARHEFGREKRSLPGKRK